MNIAEARKVTARSRSYGWFRPNLILAAGYRPCPICRTRISGEAPSGTIGDGRVATAVNRAIDEAMIVHLTDPDEGCEARGE